MIQKRKKNIHSTCENTSLLCFFGGGYFSRSNQQVGENCKRLAAATSSGGIYSLLRQDENKSRLKKKIIATGLPIKMGNIFLKNVFGHQCLCSFFLFSTKAIFKKTKQSASLIYLQSNSYFTFSNMTFEHLFKV